MKIFAGNGPTSQQGWGGVNSLKPFKTEIQGFSNAQCFSTVLDVGD